MFVGNIPYDVTETQLTSIFEEVGPVIGFRLVFDKDTGKPKGFGFCTFQDAVTAASAVRNLNGREVNGRALRIDYADVETKEESRYDEPPQRSALGSVSGPVGTSGAAANTAPSTDIINKTLDSLPSTQLLEVLSQLKFMVQTQPDHVRTLLLINPQLAYAIFQALLAMDVVDPILLQKIGHPSANLVKSEPHHFNPVIPTLMPIQQQPQQPPPPPPPPPPQSIIPGMQNMFLQQQQQTQAAPDLQAQQQQLLMILALTNEQIQALPPDQRAGVLALRASMGM